MGERDAFGREIGEDPLAELGWKKPPEPQRAQPAPNWVAPQPAPAPAKPAPTAFDAGEAWSVRGTPEPRQAPSPPRARPPRRRRRGFSRLIFLVVVLVIAGASAGSLFQLGTDAVDRGQRALRDAIPTPPAVTRKQPRKLSGSLLKPANLRQALAQLPPGRVTILTLRQDGLDATVTADGKTTLVHMPADGSVTTVDAAVSIPGRSVRLDPAAPGRIVRTATRRTGRSAASISQLVLADGTWTLQFPDGVQFTANAKGTKVRRIT